MAPKTKACGHGAGTPSPHGAVASGQDPMLQGTYLHNDADDFESPSQELAEFEERLISGGPAHSPQSGGKNISAAAAAGSGARAVAMHKKQQQPDTHRVQRPPMRSTFDVPATAATPANGHDARRTSATEEEADAHMQRQQDIADVRDLDARFGTAVGSDDSD